MSVPPERLSDPAPPGGLLVKLTTIVGIAGGLVSIAAALLVTVSVIGRWTGAGSIAGDFELVQVATALAVFSFLPLTQARRGNIMVDSFTTRLGPRANAALDALWDFVYAAMMALLAWCLSLGAREAFSSGLNSMVLQLPLAPVFTICCALVVLLAVVAVSTGIERLRSLS